nr:hypothetical protein [Actinomycetota bacterium]
MSISILLSAVLSVAAVIVSPTASDPCEKKADREACAEGKNDGFQIQVGESNDRDATSPERRPVARSESFLRTETIYVPTCLGNGPDSLDNLCDQAVTSCPVPGEVRSWIFRRTVDSRIPNDDPPFTRVAEPPF